ncbi:extracellular solute-binding protein [Cohnella fermenti]|uniref:Extracellular solute-binding protein n=1 Tax=Cohnella fermenti TaxID=2565925 RepID=A0A4S4BNB9_9BACL|nr:extracellular solute-binding protein [Cohnella fermenti]THF74003.1 extracellular solute-binding protein [Cohnella fermenti]
MSVKKTWPLLAATLFTASVVLSGCGGNNGNSNGTEASGSPSVEASKEANPSPSASESAAAEEKPATIEFWHAYGEGEEKVLLEEVLPKFKELHPNITVNATRMPTENLDQQVLTAVAGGAAPDLMRMDNTWVSRMAKEGALQTVDSFPGFDEIKERSFDGPLSTNLYNGKYYGVPLDTNTKIAIYNKELLAEAGATEPPQTIDELVTLARNLKAKGKYYGITIGGPDAWNMPPFFWTLGGSITDDNYTTASGYLNGEASVKALETIISWNDEGLLAPPILGGQPGTWEGLRGEEGSPASYMMINDGPWFFSILGDAVKDTMIPAKMPNGPDGSSHSVIGGQDLVIFNGAKQPEAAWTFSQFLLSDEIQVLMAVKTGAIPVIKTAANAEELKSVYYLDEFVAEMDTAYARTPSANWNQISDVFGKAFESALRKEATAQEALDKAAKEIDALLQ